MQIDLVITQLRAYAPVFSGRVVGSALWAGMADTVNLVTPSAYVIPLADDPGEPLSQNDVYQKITESFAVICCISNLADERGQVPAETFHTVRAALWLALLGWKPTADHRGTAYQGAHLLDLDRARAWYQFEFGADFYIGPEDGWQSNPANLITGTPTALETIHLDVDMIDPAALPNPGPDGRIELQADFDLPQT